MLLPALQLALAAAPPPAADPRFAWIAAIESGPPDTTHRLKPQPYYIDRQYLLPNGTQLFGAGSGAAACAGPLPGCTPVPVGTGGPEFSIADTRSRLTRSKKGRTCTTSNRDGGSARVLQPHGPPNKDRDERNDVNNGPITFIFSPTVAIVPRLRDSRGRFPQHSHDQYALT